MRWILIRHGKTRGNLEGRYIGCRSDESLCPEGRAELKAGTYPAVGRVFASSMRRCLETAELLYPDIPVVSVPEMREGDFGAFEGKNYAELNGREDYQAWIDSGGELPFPDGESRAAFTGRCLKAFEEIRKKAPQEDCALIIHGGTVMAIMEQYALPHRPFYDYQIPNGCGFILGEDGSWTPLRH